MFRSTGPVEAKVTAARTGAAVGGGGGTVVSVFVLWLLAQLLFHGDVGAIPDAVTGIVLVAVPAATAAGLAWWAGWRAKHTPRHDPDAIDGPGRHEA